MPTIDYTISMGTLVQGLVLLFTLLFGGFRMVRAFERRLDKMYHELDKRIGNGVVPISERLGVVESRMRDIWEWFTRDLERRRRPAE